MTDVVHMRLTYQLVKPEDRPVRLKTVCGEVAQEGDVPAERYDEVTCPTCVTKIRVAMNDVLDTIERMP